MEFNDRLRLARRNEQKTQAQVARSIGVSRATYNNYEHISLNKMAVRIRKICSALNTSPNKLFGWDDG